MNVPISPDADPDHARRALEYLVDEMSGDIVGIALVGVVDIQPGVVMGAFSAVVRFADSYQTTNKLWEAISQRSMKRTSRLLGI